MILSRRQLFARRRALFNAEMDAIEERDERFIEAERERNAASPCDETCGDHEVRCNGQHGEWGIHQHRLAGVLGVCQW